MCINKGQKLVDHFFENQTFFRLFPLKCRVNLTKMDFGWPNVDIDQKMANGQLLFLALCYIHALYIHTVQVREHM